MARRNALKHQEPSGETPVLQTVTTKPSAAEGAVALDRLIHERLRLGIVSALAANDKLTFNDLKNLLRTSDGNLSVHARKLEDGGYIVCSKTFEGRMPKTEYQITAAGRCALQGYLNHMEALIKEVNRKK